MLALKTIVFIIIASNVEKIQNKCSPKQSNPGALTVWFYLSALTTRPWHFLGHNLPRKFKKIKFLIQLGRHYIHTNGHFYIHTHILLQTWVIVCRRNYCVLLLHRRRFFRRQTGVCCYSMLPSTKPIVCCPVVVIVIVVTVVLEHSATVVVAVEEPN